MGRDISICLLSLSLISVSIHAPAWGATSPNCAYVPRTRRFNPRARMGRDFQLITLPYRTISFNPRARMGRDLKNRNIVINV